MLLRILFVFFALALLSAFSCNNGRDNRAMTDPREFDEPVAMNPNQTPCDFDCVEGLKYGSYATLLKHYLSIDSLVFVGQNTIQFADVDQLRQLTGVSQETLDDFVEKNKNSEKLRKRFDVYAKISMIEVDESIEKTVDLIEKDNPDSEGLILMSRIGSSPDNSETLIYMEHYDLSNNVTKQFCLIRKMNGRVVTDVKWISARLDSF